VPRSGEKPKLASDHQSPLLAHFQILLPPVEKIAEAARLPAIYEACHQSFSVDAL